MFQLFELSRPQMTLIKSRYFLELIFLVENVFVFHGIAEAFLIPTARVSHCLVVVAWGQNLEKHLRGCRQHSSIARERVPFKFGRWGLCHAKLVWMHTENKSTKSFKSETSLIFATFCNHRGGDRIRKGYFRGSLIFGMAQQDVLRICFDVVFYMGLAQWLRSWVLLPYLLGLVSCLHDCLHGLQIPPRSAFVSAQQGFWLLGLGISVLGHGMDEPPEQMAASPSALEEARSVSTRSSWCCSCYLRWNISSHFTSWFHNTSKSYLTDHIL